MSVGAWIRYGGPIAEHEIPLAARRYRVAILQPWEIAAARALKNINPAMIVLQYRCLSSIRTYEPGPVYSSGVSADEALAHDKDAPADQKWIASRPDGELVEWKGYPGHLQCAHWVRSYRDAWVRNVLADLEGTAFDGVLADNDVFDDYYGLNPPLAHGVTLNDIRSSLDEFIPQAGTELNTRGYRLVPNVAESRRDPGRWVRHGAYGGAFEECFLSWGPDCYLGPRELEQQLDQLQPRGDVDLVIARTATDGRDGADAHPGFMFGLACWWIARGNAAGGFSATSHDDYSGMPYIPHLDWDLGAPRGLARRRGPVYYRTFDHGWVAAHLGPVGADAVRLHPPQGLVDVAGVPVEDVDLSPHTGVMLRTT